jgi:hypothetical protein
MRSITMSIATVLLTGSLALADKPPAQNTPSIGTGGEVGTASGAQEPAPPAEGTDIQERGILPGLAASGRLAVPGATLQFLPPPTPSLTAIRNAIRVTSKSVSVNLRLPPNLNVTVPVEVSVAYNSPAQVQRLTKTYSPATGLTLLYREAEGDGKPRAMRLGITVRELVPNGKSFSFNMQFTITPLYQVDTTPLSFYMSSACDRLGKSEIRFEWFSPDRLIHSEKFKLGLGERHLISHFSWRRKEIGTQANLKEPIVSFAEDDFGTYDVPNLGSQGTALVPGPTKQYNFFLNERASGPPGQPIFSSGCQAQIKYRIDRKLMTFDQF